MKTFYIVTTADGLKWPVQTAFSTVAILQVISRTSSAVVGWEEVQFSP